MLVILLTVGLITLLHSTAGAAQSATQSASQPATLRQIKSRGTLVVGVKDNLRPLGFRDSQEQLQGLEIELAKQLAAELLGDPTAVELKPLLNQDRLPALLNGEVDLLVARVSITQARLRLVEFSRPYYVDGTAFLTVADEQLSDLQQQFVAVLNGSDTISTVRSLLPELRLRGVGSYLEAERLLDAGAVAAFAADATVLTGLAQEKPAYRLIPTLISAQALGIVMPKGLKHQALRQQINQAVERWQNNGWLEQQINYWGLPAAGVPNFID